MKKVLLHCCCAPCSSAILEWMLANDIQPTLYYCNPNIYPEEEYQIRKNEITRYAGKLGLDIIDDDYDHPAWLEYIKGTEHEPERGGRCLLCFKLRLLRTARKAAELGFEEFTTTLASSRWKSLDQINEAGRWAADLVSREADVTLMFNDRNWRKGGLQQRRNELLRENGFYNQLYCGCEFSFRTSTALPQDPCPQQ
ncbi:MAG: epoxyqueuosine reductase QueH [Bacteroidales bacterium]|nr:epoxyqueuosine reductase QueH [Candidatus Liminaster caballi]